ncbi:DEAD/DEAH box helicase [Mycolicibacterium sphagni]|uniref:DEAD/DEAH box helicase n=1 Tax=Mycolicibacterium sphagni TaxID=1786 RepID=A0ABX2K2X2_9MYCO|nr:DEAD/DEAH box helicase [Mycolicibacterium sphagni]NTY62075.1 DEAD/DEAH box helicase [Mycolicibacterium sphagni]
MRRIAGTIARHGQWWQITADPDIMIRVKRAIPGVKTSRAAALLVSDTEANGTELEWLLDRWTFDITPSDRAYLGQRADADRAREVLVQGIITGTDTVTRGSQWLTSKLPLRDYQQVAVDMIRATGSTLIVDELGLGKTLVGLALLEDPDARPGLAVTLTGWLGQQWLQELRKFYPELRGVEIKTTKAEEEFPRLWKDEKFGYDLVVINYAKLASWRHHLAGTVRTVIFDEAQELRRPESLKYEAAAHIASRSRVVTGLTATPIFNYGGEMYSLMDGIRQGCLGDREEFMREWAGFGSLSADNNGKVRIENPEALRTHLAARGLFLRRTREDVGISLPAIETVEQYVPSDPDTLNKLSGDAIEMARLLLSQDSTNTQKWQSARELDWRMRHDTGVAKAPFVADFVKLLLSSEEKIVLFGWHRAVYDIWMERLAEFNPAMYTGSESSAAKALSIKRFLHGDARILIMSLRSGAGIDGLQNAASTLVFGELDWSPGVHRQAIGRLGRPGQTRPVLAYFCTTDDGADPVMLDTLNIKSMEADRLIEPEQPKLQVVSEEGVRPDRIKLLAESVLERAGSLPQRRTA